VNENFQLEEIFDIHLRDKELNQFHHHHDIVDQQKTGIENQLNVLRKMK
jgi:hypothetical protein